MRWDEHSRETTLARSHVSLTVCIRARPYRFPSAINGQALYNAGMNKRAKKRLKESIEKENQKRAEEKKGQNPSQARTYEDRRGFTPKPEKKRG